MSSAPKADVIVAVRRDDEAALHCVETVLRLDGPAMNRLILIVDDGPGPEEVRRGLDRLASLDNRVQVLSIPRAPGDVRSWNEGLRRREGDAVLLAADAVVNGSWLVELAAAAYSDERTSGVSPLTNDGGFCSLPWLERDRELGPRAGREVGDACAGLPRRTTAPTLSLACAYLRGDVVDAVGLLDPDLPDDMAMDDWVGRARAMGFTAKRANHVYVGRSRPAPVPAPAAPEPSVPPPDDAPRFEPFRRTLDGHLAAHSVEMHLAPGIRVALDIRHLPKEQVGTRTYAVCLAQALARLPEIDLTLLVHEPDQAAGLSGRVVAEQDWCDDVALIHRPAQVFNPRELRVLFGSSSHLVVTYQDLIGYRIPHVYATVADFEGYRATSSLAMPAVQKIIAYSENAAGEIAAEFAVPREEIAVVPLGVDAAWFARREESDDAVREALGLPPRYFFSLATDYPHKNLGNLLDAYALLRQRWRGDEPPCLVLAGHAITGRPGLYGRLESESMGTGLRFLGAVTHDQLRVLYQGALALVFPSLYEGFGLPPVEAMAAGTPVIAMPISSLPEVAADCAIYPAGLSSEALARCMRTVASDGGLRDELRERGLRRVERFRWETTARATLDAYRSAIRNPSERSLGMRRHVERTLMSWGDSIFRAATPILEPQEPSPVPESMGIRNACRALTLAFSDRLRRELERFHPSAGRQSA